MLSGARRLGHKRRNRAPLKEGGGLCFLLFHEDKAADFVRCYDLVRTLRVVGLRSYFDPCTAIPMKDRELVFAARDGEVHLNAGSIWQGFDCLVLTQDAEIQSHCERGAIR